MSTGIIFFRYFKLLLRDWPFTYRCCEVFGMRQVQPACSPNCPVSSWSTKIGDGAYEGGERENMRLPVHFRNNLAILALAASRLTTITIAPHRVVEHHDDDDEAKVML